MNYRKDFQQRVTHFDVDDLSTFVETNRPKSVPERRIVDVKIILAITYRNDGLLFIDAPGGTGKIILKSLILATIRSRNTISHVIESSGITAIHTDCGRSAHSALKFPLKLQTVETTKKIPEWAKCSKLVIL